MRTALTLHVIISVIDDGRRDAAAANAAAQSMTQDSTVTDPHVQASIAEDGKRAVAIQTQYRESEAQTDPYTPDFFVKEGEDPEILQLQHMKFGTCSRR